jgi:hypothetical protein
VVDQQVLQMVEVLLDSEVELGLLLEVTAELLRLAQVVDQLVPLETEKQLDQEVVQVQLAVIEIEQSSTV